MPSRLFMSSGDLIADRRYDFARDLQRRGDLAAAADLMAQAAELAPGFASAWFALGELCEQLNQNGDAIAAYRKALGADPADRHGASLRLMRLGAAELGDMPADYVRSLFDQYAPNFDRALVEDLGYRGPQVLLQAVADACRAATAFSSEVDTGSREENASNQKSRRPLHFTCAIDLGCGTGLAADAFASITDRIVGIDLSPGMIAKAEATGRYIRLVVADMIDGLANEPESSTDLVIAADAFVYLKELAPVLRAAVRVMRPGALIGFTVETHTGAGVIIGRGLRYAHSEMVVRDALTQAGLRDVRIEAISTRTDRGEPVPGLVVTATRA